MGKDSVLDLKKPRLYTDSIFRQRKENPTFVDFSNLSDMSDTNFESTSSFRYDTPTMGIKSTQQLPIDWARFENHTFFNSAVAKSNIAIDRIINKYPFWGSKRKIESFMDSLTGFEKYVFDIFPRNVGYLIFSGETTSIAGGSHIKLQDAAGKTFSDFSVNVTGDPVLNPGEKSFSIEMQLFVPERTNGNTVICQMLQRKTLEESAEPNMGFTLGLLESATPTVGELKFMVASGSASLVASASIDRGKFTQVCAIYDRRSGENNLKLFLDHKIASTSESSYEMESIELSKYVKDYLTIGSGSTTVLSSSVSEGTYTYFSPTETLSGAIDEFRFFHDIRTQPEQEKFATQGIYPDSNTKLYYKFNEPFDGDSNVADIVLDSSHSSLHARIVNYSSRLRNTGSDTSPIIVSNNYVPSPLVAESRYRNPILFPNYRGVMSLNTELVNSGSEYDDKNPNLITRLVPSHFLTEGASSEGLPAENTYINRETDVGGASIPGSAILNSPQILTGFLLVWAKFFDELKMFIDHFAQIIHADYDGTAGVADQFLVFAAKYYGVDLPRIFNDVNVSQYAYGEDLLDEYAEAILSMYAIQNEIWRRILVNIQEIIRSKGTVYSIKALIRAAGIEPDNIFRIREFGPAESGMLGDDLRVSRTEVSTILDFSGSLAGIPDRENVDQRGFHSGVPRLVSPFLSASRVEVGWPDPTPPMVKRATNSYNSPNFHGISTDPDNGLLTSGSFTYEAIYQFKTPLTGVHYITQSLMRLHVTESTAQATYYISRGYKDRPTQGVLFNLLAFSGSNDITLYGRDGMIGSLPHPIPTLKLNLKGADIFDGGKWNISWGRIRNDDPEYRLNTAASSSFFLRAAKSSFGEIISYAASSSYHLPNVNGSESELTYLQYAAGSPVINPADSYDSFLPFIVIGSQSLGNNSYSTQFLNSVELVTDTAARFTDFTGRMSQIRFWSKALSEDEWKSHVRNFKSLGVSNPLTNFNFDTTPTGAWNRLRLDVSTDQLITESNGHGDITMIDFSQASVSGTNSAWIHPWVRDIKNASSPIPSRGGFSYFHMSGSGFEKSKGVIRPQQYEYSYLSPKFDQAETNHKVRVRSFIPTTEEDQPFTMPSEAPYARPAPVHELPAGEDPQDDPRLSIEFSCVQALDEDMLQLLSSLEFFDNAIGNPNLMFSDGYPDLESLRSIYFNRLTKKVNFVTFFEFFKWFDTSFSALIEQMIPRKVKFFGLNFVVESHVFERHKYRYNSDEIYLKENERELDNAIITYQEFTWDDPIEVG